MSRFGHVLRRVEARLEAPEPERSRILLEMARDLDDLYEVFRDQGLPEGDAVRRAESLLGASPEAVEALAGVHASGFERLARRLSPAGAHRIEGILLLLLTLGSSAVALAALMAAGMLSSPGPFHWILLTLALALMGAAVGQHIWRVRRAPPVGTLTFPALAGGALAASALGAGMELRAMAAAAAVAGAWEPDAVIVSVGRAAELLTLALTIALVALACWFQAARRRQVVESWRAEVAPLLSQPTDEEVDP